MALTFRIPKAIVTGAGAHKDFHTLIEVAGHKSAVIISDGIKVRPEVENTVVSNLNSAGIKTVEYTDVGMSVSHAVVNEITAKARTAGADMIISIGGRYAMHTGRLVAMLLSNGGCITDYREVENIKEYPVMFVAIATTSSSGAAISTCVCYNNDDTGERICFADPKLLPDVVILDPDMSSWLSPQDIANDGMISFGYAVEALASRLSTPVTDSCALEAVTNLVTWLPRIYANSNSLEYRERLMFTQQLVSMASSNAYATLACKLSGQIECMTHIGMGNSVAALLPLMIEHFQEIIPEKMEMLSEAVIRGDESLKYGGDGSCADLMRAVIRRLDMPLKLSFLGLEAGQVDQLVDSLSDKAMITNAPMPSTREDIHKLLMKAL